MDRWPPPLNVKANPLESLLINIYYVEIVQIYHVKNLPNSIHERLDSSLPVASI